MVLTDLLNFLQVMKPKSLLNCIQIIYNFKCFSWGKYVAIFRTAP